MIMCRLFGHSIKCTDVRNMLGRCKRCGAYLELGFNMSEGYYYTETELTREEYVEKMEVKNEKGNS